MTVKLLKFWAPFSELRMVFCFGCCLFGGLYGFAQTSAAPTPVTPSSANTLFSQFQTQQQALIASYQQLMVQGPTETQIEAWRQQNAAGLQAQRDLARTISATQPSRPITYITDITPPADASPALESFLQQQANLFNCWAQIHNQQLQSSSIVDENAVGTAFQQQNGTALQAQARQAQIVGLQSGQLAIPVPPPLALPPKASADLQAFLILRDKLLRAEIQFRNQNLTLSETAKASAMEQWRVQNASAFAQIQVLAKKLSQGPN